MWHKAAYLVFQPYTANATLKNCYLTKIEVTSNDNNIAGTFTLDPTTDKLTGTGTTKTITLTTKGTGEGGWGSDPRLAMRGHDYYEVKVGAVFHGASAQRICASSPTINMMLWYVFKGKPHWDKDGVFILMGHLHKGGMWIKKSTKIASENGTNIYAMRNGYPNGAGVMINYATEFHSYPYTKRNDQVLDAAQLTSTDDYFFLPALGYYNYGRFYLSDTYPEGYYWSSTHSYGTVAGVLWISRHSLIFTNNDYDNAYRVEPTLV